MGPFPICDRSMGTSFGFSMSASTCSAGIGGSLRESAPNRTGQSGQIDAASSIAAESREWSLAADASLEHHFSSQQVHVTETEAGE